MEQAVPRKVWATSLESEIYFTVVCLSPKNAHIQTVCFQITLSTVDFSEIRKLLTQKNVFTLNKVLRKYFRKQGYKYNIQQLALKYMQCFKFL